MKKVSNNDAMRLELEAQLGEATEKFNYHMDRYKKYKRDIASIEKKLHLLAKKEKVKGHN